MSAKRALPSIYENERAIPDPDLALCCKPSVTVLCVEFICELRLLT